LEVENAGKHWSIWSEGELPSTWSSILRLHEFHGAGRPLFEAATADSGIATTGIPATTETNTVLKGELNRKPRKNV